jgi:hypothetical protein
MTRVCIHQPDFAPYLGFFHRLLTSDVYIVLDDVQFIRRGWHHRDKIKTRQGEAWLSLSIQKDDYHQVIRDISLSSGTEWVDENLNLIRENYRHASHFDPRFPEIERIYRAGHEKMIDLNMEILRYFFELFDIEVKTLYASKLNVPGKSTEKLVHLVQAAGGDCYLSGTGARDYLNESMFQKAGIALEWQEFHHPVYPQQFGNFIPGLSCLDLLFNCGPESKKILRSCLNPQ